MNRRFCVLVALVIAVCLVSPLPAHAAKGRSSSGLYIVRGTGDAFKYFAGYSNKRDLSTIRCPSNMPFTEVVVTPTDSRKIVARVPFRWQAYGEVYVAGPNSNPFGPSGKYLASCQLVARVEVDAAAGYDLTFYKMYGPGNPAERDLAFWPPERGKRITYVG